MARIGVRSKQSPRRQRQLRHIGAVLGLAVAQTFAHAQEAADGAAAPMRLYWGDTHVHTSYSMDANYMGNRLTPADAYRFARGEAVELLPGVQARIKQPLDFLVVADHAEFLGVIRELRAGNPQLRAQPEGERWYRILQEGGETLRRAFTTEGGPRLDLSNVDYDPWQELVEAAEAVNTPGRFTALAGFEWSATPDGNNLHRNVVFRDGPDRTLQVKPFAFTDGPRPQQLWEYLERYEARTGGRVLAIPHNGNLSGGLMFPETDASGAMITEREAQQRRRWEPVIEVTQTKGDGETHPSLSPTDEFADYGTWDKANITQQVRHEPWMTRFEYARPALLTGLRVERLRGVNPYHFGMIGSTDTHTGLATAEEDNFWGKFFSDRPSAQRAKGDFVASSETATVHNWELLSSGYAAVWARDNTREEIFDALARREVYATTGPRIAVRFFAGWDFDDTDLAMIARSDVGYRKGVPMGGTLPPRQDTAAPHLLIQADMDPRGASLDRVQVIKGWIDAAGETHERIYDVAWAGMRQPGEDGKLPPMASSVDLKTARYDNGTGATQLAVRWADPDFEPGSAAFYYVRVLEIPTPTWLLYDQMRFDAVLPDAAPRVHQERAYTSPIWYEPPRAAAGETND